MRCQCLVVKTSLKMAKKAKNVFDKYGKTVYNKVVYNQIKNVGEMMSFIVEDEK